MDDDKPIFMQWTLEFSEAFIEVSEKLIDEQ
jgi:hypothetical protein